jgi:selenocysteine lyase/cysteine desulfurase
MSYLGPAGLAKDYCNNVEAKGAIFYIMGCEKILGGPGQSGFLGGCDGRLGRAKTFVGSGPYLDKNNASISLSHNEVNFAGFAGEVARELFKASAYKILLAASLAPSAEQLAVGQEPASVKQPTYHN